MKYGVWPGPNGTISGIDQYRNAHHPRKFGAWIKNRIIQELCRRTRSAGNKARYTKADAKRQAKKNPTVVTSLFMLSLPLKMIDMPRLRRINQNTIQFTCAKNASTVGWREMSHDCISQTLPRIYLLESSLSVFWISLIARVAIPNSSLWKRVIAWERSRAASGCGIIWGDADRNKQGGMCGMS